MKQVIIGGSIAAVGAISGIRSVAPSDDIVLISGEGNSIYSRPMISYLLASNHLTDISYPDPNFLETNRVDMINDWAISLDNEHKQVKLKSGQSISYDKLLLATGSTPIRLNLPGCEKALGHSFYTRQDAQTLKELVADNKTAAVIGSGLIGIKAAEALHSAGLKVTIVEREASILPRLLSPGLAARLEAELERLGIACHTGQQVVSLINSEVKLADGASLAADLIIMATGVKPQTELAIQGNLSVEQGIVVNNRLQTSDPDIYAAGDVTQVLNLVSGKEEVLALLPLAREQGWLAGINMAGGERYYPGAVALNAVRVGQLVVNSGGLSNIPELSWRSWQQDDRYLELFADHDKLVGFTAINMSTVTGPLYNSLSRNLDLKIDEWVSFIAAPSITTVPHMYWKMLRRCQSYDHLECS